VFTDNLYYPLVAFAVVSMLRLERRPSTATAVATGVLGGLATITRPSMFFVLLLIPCWYWWPANHTAPRLKRGIVTMSIAWMLMIGCVTFRNWLVSGRAVLIAESSLQVLFFLAPPGVNFNSYLVVPKPSIFQ